MGKGGKGDVKRKMSQLEKLDMAELRKWGAAYGVPKSDKLERDALLMELVPYAGGILDPLRPANLPLEPPKFTLMTIKNAIPRECFQKSYVKSLGHLAWDCLLVAVFGYAASHIHRLPGMFPEFQYSEYLPYIAWPVYWYWQGLVMTGLWVLAHECGHQAFTDSELLNNIVGTIFHSALLVPYHPWRITHGKHHNNTGSCDNDEVFAPSTRSDWNHEALREAPIVQWFGILKMLIVGWWPGYLIFNATGPAKYRGKNASHLSPTAVFIDPKDYWLVVQSDVALLVAVATIGYCIHLFGFATVAAYYLIPEMHVNWNLVLITYLQHTDVFMPHFRGKEWNWLRGALCTVDREYGFFYDRMLHHITDTHVCHHLFSGMPFYNARIATPYIKEVLGKYYMKDNTPIMHAVYRSYSNCQFVEDSGDTVFYKNVK